MADAMTAEIVKRSEMRHSQAARDGRAAVSSAAAGTAQAIPAARADPAAPSRSRSSARAGSPLPGTIARSDAERMFDTFLYAKAPSRQKPKKLYDVNAQSIAQRLEKQKAKEAAPATARKGLSDGAKLVVAFGLLILIGTGLGFAIPEATRIAKVDVAGMESVSQDEIVQALQLGPEANLVNADIRAMEERILSNPKIDEAKISRSFPDRLFIQLTERTPVACVFVSDGTGTRPVAVDGDGVAFAYMDTMPAAKKLPVLSGIRFENFAPGQKLPAMLLPLLGDMAGLSGGDSRVLDAFSEIKVEKVGDSGADILLYPADRPIPVRMSARLTQSGLSSALLVLDILAARPDAASIEEIDFRTGTIVYRTKEAHTDR